MGKVHSIEQLQVSAPSYPGQWIPEGRTDYCQLLRNRDSGFLAEEYIVPVDPRIPLMRTFEIYDHRRRQNDCLVEVYQAEREPPSYICQGGDYLRVKTERIPIRLSEVANLDGNKGLEVLQQALIGYKSIFTFQGPVLINDDMIGFSQNGRVKVWLNNNFAKNTPDLELNPPRYEENTYHASGIVNEAGMVSQVVDVIQEHVHPAHFKDFMNLFYATAPRSFVEALQLIKEYVTTRNTGLSKQQIVSIPTIQSVGIEHPVVSTQHYVQPQSQTYIIQNSSAPSITRSLQAPTQPYIIQNFAPEQPAIVYQQQKQRVYYVQEPTVQVIQEPRVSTYVETVAQQPPSVIYPTANIVHPRSTIVAQKRQQSIIVNQPQIIPQIVQRPIPQSTISQTEVHVNSPGIKHMVQPINVSSIEHFQPISKQIINPASVIVSPSSQIAVNPVRLNETVHASSQIIGSQIVTPKSQIVTPISQINVNPIISNPTRPSHRFSYPSPRVVQNQTRVSPVPVRNNIVQKSVSPIGTRVVDRKSVTIPQNREPSPTIFRPRASPTRKNISPIVSRPQNTLRIQDVSVGKSVPVAVTNMKNTNTNIAHPHSQISTVSKREEYRKSQVNDPHPTHNIEKVLQGIRKTNSISDPVLDILSPNLVTSQPPVKIQIAQTQTVIANPIISVEQAVGQQKPELTPFRGLPHRRNNLHQIVTSQPKPATAITTTTEVKQNQSNIPIVQTNTDTTTQPQPKTTIATQQAMLDKLEKDIDKALVDFANPFSQQQEMFTTFGSAQIQHANHPNATTLPPNIAPSKLVRPVRPQAQPNPQPIVQIPNQHRPVQPNTAFTSFNYQPFRQTLPQTLAVSEQTSAFELGDNAISNLSGIRGEPITAASGVSTFTNPLQNRAEVNEVVFTEVRSLAANDSVNPEVRKLMMQPRNQQYQIEHRFNVQHPQNIQQLPHHQQQVVSEVRETINEVIENIPMAESHQIEIRTSQGVAGTHTNQAINIVSIQQPVFVEEEKQVIETNFANNAAQRIQTERADVRVTKGDLWTSNDSVNVQGQRILTQGPRPVESIGETLIVNQTIRQNPTVVSESRTQRAAFDIESLMRKHNQQSKNLFEKYQQYGRNIERQLSPNIPTSPSSIPKQQPEIRYGGGVVFTETGAEQINNLNYQEGSAGYEYIQATELYENSPKNHQKEEQEYQQRIIELERQAQHREQQLEEEQYRIQQQFQPHLNQQFIQEVHQQTNIQNQVYQQRELVYTEQVHIQTNTIQDVHPSSYTQQPLIIHQQITNNHAPSSYTHTTQQHTTTYEPSRHQIRQTQYEQVIQTYNQTPSSRQSRGYEYVTTQQFDQVPSYLRRNEGDYFRREELGGSINFKQTTQSYVYEEVDNNIQEIRGNAPTYEELRAALLETNIGLERDTQRYEEYTTEYHYETTAYDERG